jgi:DNA (cytosine-5)-methyltransferase 1
MNEWSEIFNSNRKPKNVANHIARRIGSDVQKRIDALKIGQKMQDLPEELGSSVLSVLI